MASHRWWQCFGTFRRDQWPTSKWRKYADKDNHGPSLCDECARSLAIWIERFKSGFQVRDTLAGLQFLLTALQAQISTLLRHPGSKNIFPSGCLRFAGITHVDSIATSASLPHIVRLPIHPVNSGVPPLLKCFHRSADCIHGRQGFLGGIRVHESSPLFRWVSEEDHCHFFLRDRHDLVYAFILHLIKQMLSL